MSLHSHPKTKGEKLIIIIRNLVYLNLHLHNWSERMTNALTNETIVYYSMSYYIRS